MSVERALFTQPTGPWSTSRYVISALLIALLGIELWLLFSTPRGQHYGRLDGLLIVIAVLAHHATMQYPMRRTAFIAIRLLSYLIFTVLAFCVVVAFVASASR
jgi:hypothetical protein